MKQLEVYVKADMPYQRGRSPSDRAWKSGLYDAVSNAVNRINEEMGLPRGTYAGWSLWRGSNEGRYYASLPDNTNEALLKKTVSEEIAKVKNLQVLSLEIAIKEEF